MHAIDEREAFGDASATLLQASFIMPKTIFNECRQSTNAKRLEIFLQQKSGLSTAVFLFAYSYILYQFWLASLAALSAMTLR